MARSTTDSRDGDEATEFERLADVRPASLLDEFVHFLKEEKKWWLVPILAALAVMGCIAALSSTGAAPFIYTLF